MADDDTDLLREILPQDVVAHAESRGWNRVAVTPTRFTVLADSSSASLKQVIVPGSASAPDYALRVAEAIDKFAEREVRPRFEVLNDLLARSADVFRFRLASSDHDDSLSVEDAASLYSGLRISLMAALRSVNDPKKVYARLSSGAAEEFVKRCRIGQTERGSYVTTVACPLGAFPVDPDNDIPLTRRATTLLLNTMSAIATAVEAGDETRVLTLQDQSIAVSSNLCEAIAAMQPENGQGVLTVRCSWAPSIRPPQDVPDVVTFSGQSKATLKRLAEKLKASAPEPFLEYIASIEGLRGEPDIVKRRLGEIIVKISDGGVIKHVRMEVTPADYAAAGEAHLSGRGISFRAKLMRGVKSARIDEYRDFTVLDRLPEI